MSDVRVEKLARVLVDYSTKVRPGDKVVISSGTAAEPLVRAVYARVVEKGGHPFIMASLPGLDEIFYKYASEDQLRFVPPPVKLIYDTYDVRIAIIADENTRSLAAVDPAKLVMHQQARRELMDTFMKRSAAGDLRWVVTAYPTNALAQDADMSLHDYEDFIYATTLHGAEDPVKYWQDFSAWQQRIVDWLKGKKEVHVTAPGTDLRLSVEGRTFINCDGEHNMPDGEIFTGPVETSVEGHVHFTYPTIYSGREVSGVQLWFEKGKVVKATADKNEDFLLKTLDTDAGARYLGEFAFGTNDGINKFTREILFDEKINGSFHMALGAGYPETGSKNESAIHWDMVCDLRNGGEIRVENQLLYRNGKFMIKV